MHRVQCRTEQLRRQDNSVKAGEHLPQNRLLSLFQFSEYRRHRQSTLSNLPLRYKFRPYLPYRIGLFHRLMNSCTKEQSSRQSKVQVVFSFFPPSLLLDFTQKKRNCKSTKAHNSPLFRSNYTITELPLSNEKALPKRSASLHQNVLLVEN